MNLFIVLISLLVICATCSAIDPSGSFKVFDKHYAWNNNWNDPTHSINSTYGEGTEPTMTTTFNFTSKGCFGYPAIIRGNHFDINPTSDTLFPKQISSTKEIPMKFQYTSSGTNVAGDFAYDIFFRKDTQKAKPELEVMIWGDHNSIPIGSKTAPNAISAGNRTFDLYEGFNDGAGYFVYSFVPCNTVLQSVGQAPLAAKGSLDLDLKPFLDWLQKNRASSGKYSDSMYIDCIEAGFEVAGGNGKVTFSAHFDAK